MMAYGALVLVDAAALRAAWPLAVFLLFASVDVAAILSQRRQPAAASFLGRRSCGR
jgi:hypothetical protein